MRGRLLKVKKMKTILIQENNFMKARNEIRKNPDKKVIFSSNDDELNRKVLEKEKINILLINQKNRKDFQKQRNSGLNHVLAKIAKRSNVSIGINFDEIIGSKGKEKSNIIARIKQNIMLCNKNRLEMKFVHSSKNQRDIHDIKALGLVLGMPTWMTKNL